MNIINLKIFKDFIALFIFIYFILNININILLYVFPILTLIDLIFSYLNYRKYIRKNNITISDIKDFLGFLGLLIFSILVFIHLNFNTFDKKKLENFFILFFIIGFLIDSTSVLSTFTKYNIYNYDICNLISNEL